MREELGRKQRDERESHWGRLACLVLLNVMLEKTLESPLDCKENTPVNPKGNQPWVFINWKADAEAQILWPLDVKSPLIGKDPNAGKGWRQKEKGAAEDEMVGWHHWLNRHELSKLREIVEAKEDWRAAVHGVAKRRRQLNNWTELSYERQPVMGGSDQNLPWGRKSRFKGLGLCLEGQRKATVSGG